MIYKHVTKKRRANLSYETKVAICRDYMNGMIVREIKEKYGLKHETHVHQILKNMDGKEI